MSKCSECGREGVETMRWGDLGHQPPVCGKCYFKPGWHRDND